jgi:hypothetical protein
VNPLAIAAMIAFVLGLTVGAVTQNWRWNASTEKLKVAAAAKLIEATNSVIKVERRNTMITEQLEKTNVEAVQKVGSALAANRRLVRELGGLRDPGGRPGCTGPDPGASATPSGLTDATPSARLSREAEEFLLTEAARADLAAEYAKTCHEYAMKMASTSRSNL